MMLLGISELIFIANFFQVIYCESSEFRIVSGRKTTPLEFPHHAELVQYDSHWCGGAIIHKNWVVTAAHCLEDYEGIKNIKPDHLHVRVGNTMSTVGGVAHDIREVHIHEKYVSKAAMDTADIGLVRLKKPIAFNDYTKMIKLDSKVPKVGQTGWVMGFGKQKAMRSKGERHLMVVELPVIDVEKCQKKLVNVAKDMFCAGYSTGHKDACVGDSGGPFVSGDYLTGLVAWGIGCGREGMPGVYTSIALYVPWIEKKINSD